MVEDEDKKEEEKFDFTAEGEALGYISLDQPRVRAIEYARDNQEFYGRKYAARELVWEVISQEESEDYYDIQLSYRPSRGYAGQPGIEQFTIDKSGPITLRQILSEPRPKRGPAPVLAAVGAVVVVVATVAGLFAAGVFSSSPDLVSVSITVSPDAPARLVSPSGDVTVDVPLGRRPTPLNCPTASFHRLKSRFCLANLDPRGRPSTF